MGCDIHVHKEKLVDGKWLTADEWKEEIYGDEKYVGIPFDKRFTGRNYNLFGTLSKGVRRDIPFAFEQRGMPLVSSEEVQRAYEYDGDGGHSHSYLYLHELRELSAFLKSASITISGMKNKDELAKLQESIDAPGDTDWDLLYPYCQSTNDPKCVDFSIEAPAHFMVGDGGVDELIAGFDGIEGDNHRIVFWFDN